MKTIWKTALNIEAKQTIRIPMDWKPLCIQVQWSVATMWFSCDSEQLMCNVDIFCVGTGQEIPKEAVTYLGTVQNATLVWHFFTRLV